MAKTLPARGEFVALDDASWRTPASLDDRVQSLGCLNFVRLEGLAIDREKPNAFYFTDRLGTGQFVTSTAGGGRLYHVTLDPFDPTQVQDLEVLRYASDGDDLFRPSSIDTDDQSVMIEEYPGTRGVHASRILRYLTRERRLEPVAVCAERRAPSRTRPPPPTPRRSTRPSAASTRVAPPRSWRRRCEPWRRTSASTSRWRTASGSA